RKVAHFLFLDCRGSDGPNDLYCRIALNSSNWRNLPRSFLAYNSFDLHDGTAMPAIDSRIFRRGLPVQPTYFRPPCFIAQPGSFLPLQFSQFAHDPEGLRAPFRNRTAICA